MLYGSLAPSPSEASSKDCLAGKLDATGRIDIDDLDLHDIADLDDIVDILDIAVGQFGDVTHAVCTGCDLDEAPKSLVETTFPSYTEPTLIVAANCLDLGKCLGTGNAIRRGNRDGAVIIDIDVGPGAFLDAAMVLPPAR